MKTPKNITPHDITVTTGEVDIVYPASGLVARVEMVSKPGPPLEDGCPTIMVSYGQAEMPEGITDDDLVIVSTMFADAYRRQHGNKQELLVPDSGPSAVRKDGRIIAVKALIRR